ncbi:hypothetical protein [Streptomyces sp. NPDC093544]|uniref:hypothetical protein n=1 Tax=Streptomyces sp. NPDC093544 TaxID=3155200 RepID=UPI003434C309
MASTLVNSSGSRLQAPYEGVSTQLLVRVEDVVGVVVDGEGCMGAAQCEAESIQLGAHACRLVPVQTDGLDGRIAEGRDLGQDAEQVVGCLAVQRPQLRRDHGRR